MNVYIYRVLWTCVYTFAPIFYNVNNKSETLVPIHVINTQFQLLHNLDFVQHPRLVPKMKRFRFFVTLVIVFVIWRFFSHHLKKPTSISGNHTDTQTHKHKPSDEHMNCSRNRELFWRWLKLNRQIDFMASLKPNIYIIKSINNYIVLSAMAINTHWRVFHIVYVKRCLCCLPFYTHISN